MATPFPFQSPITSAGHNSRHDQLEALYNAAIAAGFNGATTTLTAQALAGQPDLVVASVNEYQAGDAVYVGFSGSGLVEPAVIDSINALTITLTGNLGFTHPIGTPVSRSPAEVVAARGTAATLKERLDELELGWTHASGLVEDGVTDNHGALQAKADLAGPDGVLYIPPGGPYLITDTLVVQGAIEASGALLLYTGTGTALRVRNGSGTTRLERKRLNLPLVQKASPAALSGRASTLIGVELVNTYSCDVYVPWSRGFGVGLLLTSFGTGNVYNTVHLGHLDNNKVNLKISPGDAGAWVNENTYIGGRLSMDSAEGTNIAGSRHILVTSGANQPNNHRFIGQSVEGSGPEWTVETFGTAIEFDTLRWEGTPKVHVAADATSTAGRTVIWYGYNAHVIAITEDAGVTRTHHFHGDGQRLRGSGAAGVLVAHNALSNDNPAFVAMPAEDNVGTNAATRYGWRAGQKFMDAKATADTGARLRIRNAEGRIEIGPGDGTFDTHLRRIGAGEMWVGSDLWVFGVTILKTKAGAFADGDFVGAAQNGGIGIDSTNGRIYFRYGGAWHYVAQTAGFQIPADERDCPSCGKRMRKGQRVIGRIESTMKDGALHGLWEHLDCPQ